MKAALVALALSLPQILAGQTTTDSRERGGFGRDPCVQLPERLLFCPAETLWNGAAGFRKEDRLIGFAGDVGLVIQVFPADGVPDADDLRADLNALAEAIVGTDVAGFVPLVEDRPDAGAAAVRFAWATGAQQAPQVSAMTYAAWEDAIAVVHTSIPGDSYFTEAHAMLHDAALAALRPAE